jgi:hypothetical protein
MEWPDANNAPLRTTSSLLSGVTRTLRKGFINRGRHRALYDLLTAEIFRFFWFSFLFREGRHFAFPFLNIRL